MPYFAFNEKIGADRVVLQFHWQFHPAAHLFREILDSGRYGRVLRTNAVMTASPGVPDGDIRWQFELSGQKLANISVTFHKTPSR